MGNMMEQMAETRGKRVDQLVAVLRRELDFWVERAEAFCGLNAPDENAHVDDIAHWSRQIREIDARLFSLTAALDQPFKPVEEYRKEWREKNLVAKIDRWWDRETRSWIVQRFNAHGDQIGEAHYDGTKAGAVTIEKQWLKEMEEQDGQR